MKNMKIEMLERGDQGLHDNIFFMSIGLKLSEL